MLEGFRVARYQVELAPREAVSLPGFMGSALRGGFGSAFRQIACSEPARARTRDCRDCLLHESCPYAYVFETAPPAGSERLRTHAAIPRPFVLEPPLEQRATYAPGEILRFGLVLVGRAIDYLPYFIVTFRELGNWGLGRGRGRFELSAVRARTPAGEEVTLYAATRGHVVPCPVALTGRDLAPRAAELAGPRLALRFITMTRLVSSEELVRVPVFHVLVRALLRRVANLAYFHHGWSLDTDFREMARAAAAVRLVENRTQWVDWERYSSRQDARIKLGGIVGRAVYAGDLGPFTPLLLLGTYVHVGKNATFGLGRYEAERE